jgi:hypothetical protein
MTKTKHIMNVFTKLSLAVLVITAFACKKTIETPPNEITLNGNWNMKNVSGGLMGLNLDYNPGEVIWNFNTSTNELLVTNNILTTGPKSIYARFQSGTYNYFTIANNSMEQLYVDSALIGVITIGPSTLNLDDGVAADGFMTVFEK